MDFNVYCFIYSLMKAKKMKTFGLFLAFSLIVACSDERGFRESQTFVGVGEVSASTLSLGKQVYLEYCMACHGREGAGDGPAAAGSFPPPRNFTQGLYKFGLVENYGLPTDEDFHRIIKYGLHGTGMFAWDISDQQIHAVTQYIKTFAADVWKSEDRTIGDPVRVEPNPYTEQTKAQAIERGKEVYHFAANCQSCHRAYLSESEYTQLYQKVNSTDKKPSFDAEFMYKVKPQYTSYEYSDGRSVKAVPPDFTWHSVRSAQTVEDLYKRLIVGVEGAGMPGWRGMLSEEDIWALSYYVKSLMELKDHPDRKEFMENLQ